MSKLKISEIYHGPLYNFSSKSLINRFMLVCINLIALIRNTWISLYRLS